MAKCKKYILITNIIGGTSVKDMAHLASRPYEDMADAYQTIQRVLGHDSWKLRTFSEFCQAWNDDMLWEAISTYTTVIRVKRKKKANQ